MSKSIFITATGTDVGKTYVSALLLKKMRELEYNCGYYKPALSGAIRDNNGILVPGDASFVLKTANLDIEPMSCVSYCFEEALSPHLASSRFGVEVDLSKIQLDFQDLSKDYDYMIIEGAGGITCPFVISDYKTMLLPDVITGLGVDIIIVADGGLGTINSVILTVEYAKAHKLSIRGIILNNYDADNFMHRDNLLQIERLTGIKVVATVSTNSKDIEISSLELLSLFR